MRRSITYRRVVASALALLWALVPLASVMHSDGHGHRYCAEHRAFEEDVPGSETKAPAVPDDVIVTADATDGDGHVRCPIAHPGSRDATPVTAAVDRGEWVGDVHRLVSATCGVTPIDVLAHAPKASPPHLLS